MLSFRQNPSLSTLKKPALQWIGKKLKLPSALHRGVPPPACREEEEEELSSKS